MSKRTIFFLFQVLVGVVFSVPEQARADEYHVFLTVSCLPAIGYFSIQTHGVYNPLDGAIESDTNILTTQKLERTPYNCNLSEGVTISVKGFCRSQVNPEEVRCGPGGPGVEEIGIFANGELLEISDPPTRTTESRNWLTLSLRDYFRRHSVQIYAARERERRLNVTHCRLHETPSGYGAELGKVDTECQAFWKVPASR